MRDYYLTVAVSPFTVGTPISLALNPTNALSAWYFYEDRGPVGPKGDTGDTGPQGPAGDTGPQGDLPATPAPKDLPGHRPPRTCWDTGPAGTLATLPAPLRDFGDDLLPGGYAVVSDATAAHLGDEPTLSNLEAFLYDDSYDLVPRFTNQWAGMRLTAGTALVGYELRVGRTDLSATFARYPASGWTSKGTSHGYDYYAQQVADKPADDSLLVVLLSPLGIDTNKVRIDLTGSLVEGLPRQSPANTVLLDGAGQGDTITAGNSPHDTGFIEFSPAVDIDDAANQTGLVIADFPIMVTTRSHTTIKLGGNFTDRANVVGFVSARDLLAAAAYDANARNGVLLGELDVTDTNGSLDLGDHEIYIGKNANGRLGYNIYHTAGQAESLDRNWSFSVPNAYVEFQRHGPSVAAVMSHRGRHIATTATLPTASVNEDVIIPIVFTITAEGTAHNISYFSNSMYTPLLRPAPEVQGLVVQAEIDGTLKDEALIVWGGSGYNTEPAGNLDFTKARLALKSQPNPNFVSVHIDKRGGDAIAISVGGGGTVIPANTILKFYEWV